MSKKSVPPAASVTALYGQYLCGECGHHVALERQPPTETRQYLIGSCSNMYTDCTRRGVRLRIPVLHLTCEVLP